MVDDVDYPGFCRVILNMHITEMTDLPPEQRHTLMQAVWAVEASIRAVLAPDKINLASLGNIVPHLHWHVIPRRRNDRHFPAPIWGEPVRSADVRGDTTQLANLKAMLASKLLMLESFARE